MRTIAGASVVLLAYTSSAAAQPGMYAAPPPGATPAVVTAVEPKLRFEIGIASASPRGDWQTAVPAERSPGFHLQLGFAIAPNISLFGGLRYVRVKVRDTGDLPSDLKLSDRQMQLGLRFATPISPGAKLFAEANVSSTTLAIEFQDQRDSASGVGFGARAGLFFMAGDKVGLGAAVSYSSAAIDTGGDPFADDWAAIDGFVSFWF